MCMSHCITTEFDMVSFVLRGVTSSWYTRVEVYVEVSRLCACILIAYQCLLRECLPAHSFVVGSQQTPLYRTALCLSARQRESSRLIVNSACFVRYLNQSVVIYFLYIHRFF